MATAYRRLSRVVDGLTPEQADAVRGIVQQLVAGSLDRTDAPVVEADADGRARRLSFAGVLRTGRADLAARSEEII